MINNKLRSIIGKNCYKKFIWNDYSKEIKLPVWFCKLSSQNISYDNIKKIKKDNQNINKNKKLKKKKNKKMKQKKVKKCGWCQINNKELKKILDNKKKEKNKLKICRCKMIYYCSYSHQKHHWKKKHRMFCNAKIK